MNFFKKWKIKRKCAKGGFPPFICHYYEQIFNDKPSKNTLLSKVRFVVLDTETTGLDIAKDLVLSVGAIAIENGEILVKQSLEIVINCKANFKADVVAIHGLTLEDLEKGQTVSEAMEIFLRFLGADVIVAHHTGFDMAMLQKTIQSIAPSFELDNHFLDTALLAQRVDFFDNPYYSKVENSYDLDALCRRFNIEMHDRHTAWGDAIITALLFLKLTKILDKRGVKTLKDLMRPLKLAYPN